MKTLKCLSLILTAHLALYAIPSQSLEGAYTGPYAPFVPGEIIVKMKPAAASLRTTDLSALGILAEDKLTSGGEIIYRIQPTIMRGFSSTQAKDRTLEIVEELKKQPGVQYAQPNFILHIMKTPNDSLYPKQWHYFNYGSGSGESLGGIDLPKAWDISTGGDVVVAVVDTGILPNHEDIAGSPNLVAGYDMITDTTTANDGDGRDSDATDPGDAMKKGECFFGLYPDKDIPSSWHGTHVAGTIGVGKTNNNLGVAGINWTVKVQPVRVLGKCGGTTTDINDGIRWAAGLSVSGVPANPTPAKVINMSLGGEQPCSQSPATQQAINDAVNAGVTVVVAAGNGGSDGVGDDASGSNPAGCDNVITVAAADPQGKLTPYSNWGNTVEILAPGGWTESGCPKPEAGVLSMVQTSADRGNCGVAPAYAFYNGTSMATPHVAGVAALWLAQDPSLTPKTLLAALQKVARPRTSAECPKPCGAGLLNAVMGTTPTPTPQLTVNLTLDPDKSTYSVGDTAKTQALVKLDGTPQAGKTVLFSSSNNSVAQISPASATTNAAGQAEAVATANAAGSATLTAQADSAKAQKSFNVQTQAPQLTVSLILDPDKSSYRFGEIAKARALVKLDGAPQAGKTVQFGSSNNTVAQISPTSATTNAAGQAETTVTAMAAGSATVTAQADGAKAQKSFSVQKVPDLSGYGIAGLLILIVTLDLVRRRTISV